MHFVTLESIQDVVDIEFKKQNEYLSKLIPSADIQHVGSTAVPGSITKGDIDIQVRVGANEFARARELLGRHYIPSRKDEIWRNGFASFVTYDHPTIPIGIQLTTTGSKYDEFYKVRDLFIKDSDLLEKYNEMKRGCEGRTYLEYRKHKRRLFGHNGANPLLVKK